MHTEMGIADRAAVKASGLALWLAIVLLLG